VGAHHQLVHLYENRSATVEQAVEHGGHLAGLAPGVAHARHMFGHNLARLGMSYHHQGRIPDAERTFQILAELPISSPHRQLYQRMNLVEFQLALGRWEAALEESRDLQGLDEPLLRAGGYVYEALSRLGRGEVGEADRALREAKETLPARGNPFGFHLEALELMRSIDSPRSDRDHTHADEIRRELTEILSALTSRRGPDAWAEAHVRMEMLASWAEARGHAGVLEAESDALLAHDPSYGGGHYRQSVLARDAGDVNVAEAAARKARSLWPAADPGFRSVEPPTR
jgi:tetratricopeptide (TPR) repeat protein